MLKRSIPNIPAPGEDGARHGFDAAVKETLEVLTGRRGGKIKPLPDDASQAEIVAKINEMLDRYQ